MNPDAIKIESNVPMPPLTKLSKFPFASMEVGDSFFVPHMKTSAEMSGAIALAKRKHGFKFVCRRIIENSAPIGIRVWRTA